MQGQSSEDGEIRLLSTLGAKARGARFRCPRTLRKSLLRLLPQGLNVFVPVALSWPKFIRCLSARLREDVLRAETIYFLKTYSRETYSKVASCAVTSAAVLRIMQEVKHELRGKEASSSSRYVALFGLLCPQELEGLLRERVLTPLHVILAAAMRAEDDDGRGLAAASHLCDSIVADACDYALAMPSYYQEKCT